MAAIASEVLISRLADWGVDTVFGLPGDGINGIMEGLRRNAERVRFVLVHHEEAAAFMAGAYAKATGKIGVCLATSGPGGIHLANGLYDAKLDHAPVLAITGMQETSVLGTAYQQEVDLTRLFEDVSVYNQTIVHPAQLPALAGIGARGAGRLVEEVADVLGAPIIKTLSGKMVVPDDSPYVTGGIGLLGTRPTAELVEDIDTLLMLGTNFPYTKHLPPPGKVKVVQVEIDPARAGTRLPTDVPLIGDVGATLEALLPRLRRREDRSHLERYQEKVVDWRAQLAALESPTREPIAPQYLAHEIDRLATDNAVLTCDS